MTTSVKFCLSYNPLKWDFIAFKMGNIPRRKRIVDINVVNDVTSTRRSVITRVVIRFLRHDIINWITATPYDKCLFIKDRPAACKEPYSIKDSYINLYVHVYSTFSISLQLCNSYIFLGCFQVMRISSIARATLSLKLFRVVLETYMYMCLSFICVCLDKKWS